MSVYFVSARDLDMVKIGYARNPVLRFKHLRTFSPVKLTLEGAIPGGFEKERELHRRFAPSRAHGEWFRLTSDLQSQIDDSTRPNEFTWAAMRKWLKTLALADEAIERKVVPPIVVAMVEERLQSALNGSARRKALTMIQRREADGDIHFPFRVATA